MIWLTMPEESEANSVLEISAPTTAETREGQKRKAKKNFPPRFKLLMRKAQRIPMTLFPIIMTTVQRSVTFIAFQNALN